MLNAAKNFLILSLFLSIIFLGVFAIIPHEGLNGVMCPFSFLFNANCRNSENIITFIASHLAGFRQIFGALTTLNHNISIFLLLLIAVFYAFFLFAKNQFLELPRISFQKFASFLDNGIIFSNYLLSWLKRLEIRDPN